MRQQLTEQFGYKNALAGAGDRKDRAQHGRRRSGQRPKKVTLAAADLALIAGQKPVITHARKAIATFKVRENMPIGCQGDVAQDAHVRVPRSAGTIALPRVRDFRGLNPKSFDGRGNYALGIKEHIIFPEINYDKVESVVGHGHHRLHHGEIRRRGARPVDAHSTSRSGSETRASQTRRPEVEVYGQEKLD